MNIIDRLTKNLTILLLTIILVFNNHLLFLKPAVADIINNNKIAFLDDKNYDWAKIDKSLTDKIKDSLLVAEEFATEELDDYIDELMVNVDQDFLDWYFSFFNQKSIEYGGVISWVGFKLDKRLKLLRKEDEKNLNSSEIIAKRLTRKFYDKFQELVFTKSAQKDLKKIIERTGKIYGNSISLVFADIKNDYKIDDRDWDSHLGELAQLIYNTGNSKSSLSLQSLGSSLLTETTIVGAVIGAKLFSNIALKAGSKLAVKGGTSVAVSTTAKLIDPLLAIGFVAWDVWDYKNMVADSRPILRKNILDYLTEFKNQILQDPEIGIVPKLEEIEYELIKQLPSFYE